MPKNDYVACEHVLWKRQKKKKKAAEYFVA